ncbi:MAG TPA: hypothetical protein VD793_09110, partial [Gemmatimonadales bacterium]|nr:hypothetical protein [Gemmatimonadales bacterium]
MVGPMTRNRWIFLPRPLVALVGSLLAACLGDAVEPVRDLRVVLESPHGAEGAAVMEVVGVGVSDVVGPAGTYTHVSGDTTRVVILLEEPGAIEF